MQANDRDEIPADFRVTGTGKDLEGRPSERRKVRELAYEAAIEIGLRGTAPYPESPAHDDSTMTLEEASARLEMEMADLLEMVEHRRLIASHDPEGEAVIPSFQIVGDPPRIAEDAASALAELVPVCHDPRTLLAWFVAPKDELDGVSPARWIEQQRDPGPLLLAARRDAARLS